MATEEYFSNRNFEDFSLELHKSLSTLKPLMIINEKFIHKLPEQRYLLSLLLIHSVENFNKITKNFTGFKFNYRGFYLVLFENGTDEEVNRIFKGLWDLYIFNTNLIRRENNTIRVDSFMPFTPRKCNSTELVEVARYENGKFTKRPRNVLPKKVYKLSQLQFKVGHIQESRTVSD